MTDPGEPAPLVSVQGLCKTFPNGTRALAGVDLRITRPGIFGIVGPDGAGKTTLLRTLVGILDFEGESVEVLGHVLPRDARKLKAEVGYVPQIWGLYPDMSIGENLQFFASIRGIPKGEFEARKGALLEATGLAPFEGRLAGQLSGGMKQKLAITPGASGNLKPIASARSARRRGLSGRQREADRFLGTKKAADP